jgi:hypothetical protein
MFRTGLLEGGIMGPPNGLRFTRTAPIDRDMVRVHPDAKMAPILPTRSGVGWKRVLGCTLVCTDDYLLKSNTSTLKCTAG